MIQLFLCLLLLVVPATVKAGDVFGVENPADVFGVTAPDEVFGVAGLALTCQSDYAPALTADGYLYIGDYSNEVPGGKIQLGHDTDICSVYVYYMTPDGTPAAGERVYMRVYADNAGDLGTNLGTSTNYILANGLTDNAYNGPWTFTTITGTSGSIYYIKFIYDIDGDPGDQPEAATSGRPRFGFDDENNKDAVLLGVANHYDSTGGQIFIDAEDDLAIKIYGMQ